jgi:hypothetical protein
VSAPERNAALRQAQGGPSTGSGRTVTPSVRAELAEAPGSDERRRIGIPRVVLTALLWLIAVGADAQEAPIRIVPADDAPLASMMLLAAGPSAPVLLFDPRDAGALRRFLDRAGRPVQCVVRATTPAAARTLLESTAGTSCTRADDLLDLARTLWPQTRRAVIVPTASYEWLLRGAALAAAAGAALLPVSGDAAALGQVLTQWSVETVYVLPGAANPTLPNARVIHLKTPDAVGRVTLRRLGEPPRTVVVANPQDRQGWFSPASLSLLAPLIAATHKAPLVLVDNSAADAVEAEVQRFIAANQLAPTHIYLVGDELALRSHRVADPVLQAGGPEALGGGRDLRVELFSELQYGHPQDYAVGRFVAEDVALGSATLARQLHTGLGDAGKIVLLSNADREFALGETIARTTVSELRNVGLAVRAEYGAAVTPAAIQQGLDQAGLLVWEGHARDLTLEERGGLPVERTPPLVILQGCYTLDRSDPFILLEHGTQAIVATSAAIYSASGSSFARALFDAVLYGDADLGTAVRNARNYLLAVAELKKLRRHADWPKTYRAALAFALWGDPTAHPALPAQPPKLPPVQWRVDDGALELTIPSRRLKTASVAPYSAAPVPRAMLSALVLRDGEAPERQVKELFYDVLAAPADVTAACPPAPGWEVVSFYAPHTRTLSVLARPQGDVPDAGAAAGVFRLPLRSSAAQCTAAQSGLPPLSHATPAAHTRH